MRHRPEDQPNGASAANPRRTAVNEERETVTADPHEQDWPEVTGEVRAAAAGTEAPAAAEQDGQDGQDGDRTLPGRRIAFLVAPEGVEQVELAGPWRAVSAAGATPVLLSYQTGEVQTFNHLDKGDTFVVDELVADASVDDYDALVLPGGVANPDALRLEAPSVEFVRAFVRAGLPVAAICHAPWLLVEADVVRGRRLTSWPSLRTDLENAGASWVDQEVSRDGNLVTSRKPDDIPAFCTAFIDLVAGRPVRT